MLRPILLNESGLTILSTGMIRIAESGTYFSRYLHTPDAADPERSRRVHLAYGHECIHFFQTFTTAWVFQYCERIRSLTSEFAEWLRSSQRDLDRLETLRESLIDAETSLDKQTGADPIDGVGITPRQLMEAHALIESLHSVTIDLDLREVMAEIKGMRDDGQRYSRVLGIMARAIGPDLTVRLLSGFAFVALNYDEPGAVFCDLLREFMQLPQEQREGMRRGDVLSATLDSANTLVARFARKENASASTIWNAYGQTFAGAGELPLVHRLAAYPSALLSRSNWSDTLGEKARSCVPPFVMFEDGTGRIMGLAQTWEDKLIRGFVYLHEVLGVFLQISSREKYVTPCQHNECPGYAVSLCHLAYPPSIESSWTDCPFRTRFAEWTSTTPEAFARAHETKLAGFD